MLISLINFSSTTKSLKEEEEWSIYLYIHVFPPLSPLLYHIYLYIKGHSTTKRRLSQYGRDVIEEGEHNFKRYSLRINPPLDLSIVAIEKYLARQMRVQEIIIENKPYSTIPYGGLQIYAKFNSIKEALDFPRKHTIEGHKTRFRHIGLYECLKCKQKGHTEDRWAKIQKAKQRALLRKQARRKRKRESQDN